MFNVDVNKKNLLEIQNALKDVHYDALIVPHEDEFLGEYISEDKQRLAFLLGFTGSAGSCVVYADNCIPTSLFVDGRYTIQARKQTPEEVEIKNFQSQLDTIHDAIANLKEGNTVAIDPRLHSMNWFNQAKSLLEQKQIKLVNCKKNFIDQIWRNKPETEKKPLIMFPAKYYGTPSTEKRERIAETLKERELDAMFIADSESVNWILNIRGHDIPYLPIVRCFAIIYSNQSMDVFIDNEKLITSQFAQQCGSDVSLFAFSKLEETLSRMGDDHLVVGYDEQKTNAYTVLKLQKSGATLIKIKDPCDIAKAVKTNVEIEGFRTAHVKDGVAMCRFLSWLDRRCSEKNEENEETLAVQAEKYRQDQENYIELSFATISALGPNAAMCHYNHENADQPRQLGQDPLYLIDSGAHYYDGTTDITRTVAVGTPTQEMIDNFTRVLKGHIALAKAVFPIGTLGIQLDILARQYLWDIGLDFAHGTGHGIGHCLSVHEGPQRISPRLSVNDVGFQKNMIITDEPGYYKNGEYGIRCENVLAVVDRPNYEGSMLSFEVLTMVPFDLKLINSKMLSATEKEWLNNYHKKIRETIQPFLSDREISWLISATKTIE